MWLKRLFTREQHIYLHVDGNISINVDGVPVSSEGISRVTRSAVVFEPDLSGVSIPEVDFGESEDE